MPKDEKIELTDDKNTVRVRIGVNAEGCPYLSLNGADGRERIVLSVDADDNGSIGFRTASGQPTLTFGVSSQSMGLSLLDVQNDSQFSLELFEGEGE